MNLSDIMKEYNISGAQAAQLLGLNRQTIYNYRCYGDNNGKYRNELRSIIYGLWIAVHKALNGGNPPEGELTPQRWFDMLAEYQATANKLTLGLSATARKQLKTLGNIK